MTYKFKTLSLLAGLFVSFSYLFIANAVIAYKNAPTYFTPITFAVYMAGWDIPLVAEPDEHKEATCKQSRECEKLAEAVVFEARSESMMGRYAVANVIMKRVESRRWPNTIMGVVHQRFQFEYLDNMHRQTPPTRKDWREARVIAYDVTQKRVDPIVEADHYHTIDIKPWWAKKLFYVATIGRHHFYSTLPPNSRNNVVDGGYASR